MFVCVCERVCVCFVRACVSLFVPLCVRGCVSVSACVRSCVCERACLRS